MWKKYKDNTVQFWKGMDKEEGGTTQDKILITKEGEDTPRYQEIGDLDLSLLNNETFGEGTPISSFYGVVGEMIIEVPTNKVIKGLIVNTPTAQIGTFGGVSIELEEGVNMLDMFDLGPLFTISVDEICDVTVKFESNGLAD